MKHPAPQLALSLKVFGNDLYTLGLEDIPLLNGDMDNFNIIGFLHQWSKGRHRTIKQDMILIEASHSVPTLLGLPLKLNLNGTASIAVKLKANLKTKNLIMGPRSLTGKFQISAG